MKLNSGRYKLAQNVDNMRDAMTCDAKVDKAPNKVTISAGVPKRLTISGPKVNSKLHESVHGALIINTSTGKKLLSILLLGEKSALRHRRHLKTKEILKWT